MPGPPAYHVVEVLGDDGGREMELAAEGLSRGVSLRMHYRAAAQSGGAGAAAWRLSASARLPELPDSQLRLPPFAEYARHVAELRQMQDGHCRSAARGRLDILHRKFDMYHLLNEDLEDRDADRGAGDVLGARKVDMLRLSTAVDGGALVARMRHELRHELDEGAGGGDGGVAALLRRCGLTADTLTVEALGLRPRARHTFHRFDVFSRRTHRIRRGGAAGRRPVAELLTAFLRHRGGGGAAAGRRLAALTRPALTRTGHLGAGVAAEFEVPIRGARDDEWAELAAWAARERLLGGDDARLCACLPRLRETEDHFGDRLGSVADQLRRFFAPMWAATARGAGEVFDLLQRVASVSVMTEEEAPVPELPDAPPSVLPAGRPRKGDDGARVERRTPDAVFVYHFWAQLCALNEFRRRRGLGTFALRLSCAEPKNLDHLLCAFLLADSVSHGAHLANYPALTYLYYLCRVGVAQSPTADAARAAVPYHALPFAHLLRCGLRVCLATADPLHFHRTPTPLLEEYAAAASMWKLSAVDLCEAAAHSTAIARWARGRAQHRDGAALPPARRAFRRKTYDDELRVLAASGRRHAGRSDGDAAYGERLSAFKAGHRQTEDYLGKLGRLDINGPAEDEDSSLPYAAEEVRGLLELRRGYIHYVPGARRRGGPPAGLPGLSAAAATSVLRCAEEAFDAGGVYDAGVDGGTGPGAAAFVRDYERVCRAIERPEVLSLAARRLGMLEHKFGIHASLQRLNESGRDFYGRPTNIDDHRDFYRTVRVDTHVHMAAGMTASQLLEFIRDKAEHQGDDVVSVEPAAARGSEDGLIDEEMEREGHLRFVLGQLYDSKSVEEGKVRSRRGVVTLREVLHRVGITDPASLTVDTLGVQTDVSLFERFDNFNAKYSPMGESTLRDIFLKTVTSHASGGQDVLGGRYFAELVKRTFRRYAPNHYAENRLSIYGRSDQEWSMLARWFTVHGMGSAKNKWIIQVPRLYATMRQQGIVSSFAKMLANIFGPLWRASAEPERYPQLDHFLRHISGFDSVDSEAHSDLSLTAVPPQRWVTHENPPYAYWLYYMWANIRSLNAFRASRGQSTLSFRPHCGECGDVRHLAAAFLVADGVSHGIQLRENLALQYLYYLARVPLAVSPLSNNSLFLALEENPFPEFFRRGLFVSLSTDDPLFFHQTQEPLVEEYSVAGKLWRLSSTDLCEIARNSVVMSGFDRGTKQRWAGEHWYLDSSAANDSSRTNVPDIRVAFRFEVYHDECTFLNRIRDTKGWRGAIAPLRPWMRTLEQEDAEVPGLDEFRSKRRRVGARL